MKKLLCVLVLFAMIPTMSVASNAPTPEKRASDALGVSLGWITGRGIMYRHYFGDNYMQLGMIAYYNKDNEDKYGDLAFAMGRYIHYTNFSEQFFPVGLKVMMGGEVEIEAETEIFSTSETRTDDYFHFGAGVGLDIGNPVQKGFAVSFDLNYIASFRDFDISGQGLVFIEPRPGVSFFYNF